MLEIGRTEVDSVWKYAVLNGLGLVVVLVSCVCGWALYSVLHPFLRPLLWALLVGSALHPVKQALVRTFLSTLDPPSGLLANLPVTHLIFTPLIFIVNAADCLGDLVFLRARKLLPYLSVAVPVLTICFFLHNYVYKVFFLFMLANRFFIDLNLALFENILVVTSIVLGYILGLVFLWKPENNLIFSSSSLLVWLSVTSYLSNLASYLKIPLFVGFQFSLCASFLYSLYGNKNGQKDSDTSAEEDKSEGKVNAEDQRSWSIVCLKWLSLSCLLVLLISLQSSLYIVLLLTSIYTIKRVCYYFGVIDSISCYMNSFMGFLSEWAEQRKDVLLHTPLHCILKVVSNIFEKLSSLIKTDCDTAATLTVILALLFSVSFGSVFLSIQAYKESMYFVTMGGSLFNSTIVHHPEINKLLPEDWRSTLETTLNNSYVYARNALSDFINSSLEGKGLNESKKLELEKSVLELWDRIYQAWVVPSLELDAAGPIVTSEAVIHSYSNLIDSLSKTPEVLSFSWLGSVVSENMTTVTAGLDSIWLILKSHLSLLIYLVWTLFAYIFGGGVSVINFMLNVVVFLAALSSLLNTSRDLYKPVELITQLSPEYGNKLAVAVEEACKQVLAASLRLSLFYGMWTWLIHTLFQSNFVYIPAVVAALLGAMPVLPTYIVCVPACLDLWLVHNNFPFAVMLLVAQLLPPFFFDSIVYKEMQGGHPYLTGLSVAGGMFWLGLEGAVIGPLILCFMFVIINMASSISQTSS